MRSDTTKTTSMLELKASTVTKGSIGSLDEGPIIGPIISVKFYGQSNAFLDTGGGSGGGGGGS